MPRFTHGLGVRRDERPPDPRLYLVHPRTFGLFRFTPLMLQFPLPAGRGGLGWGGPGLRLRPSLGLGKGD